MCAKRGAHGDGSLGEPRARPPGRRRRRGAPLSWAAPKEQEVDKEEIEADEQDGEVVADEHGEIAIIKDSVESETAFE